MAVNAKTNKPTDCNRIDCSKCLFYGAEFGACSDKMVNWANQDYKEPFVISYNDSLFLNFIKVDYEYMVRDKNGDLFAYVNIPKKSKDRDIWIDASGVGIYKFNIDFPMIKWSDKQPWKISDLKNLKVVENY